MLGDVLEAALEVMRPHGRIVACGMVSQYDAATAGPSNLNLIVRRRLTIRGFTF
jgi:NADPH-dependent curcumin reductase CurA